MHRVRWFIWNHIDGRMAAFDRYVESLEKAKQHLRNTDCDSFKVYDDKDQMVHSGTNITESYS